MSWEQFADGLRLDPVAKQSAKALVVLLHDIGLDRSRLMLVPAVVE